MHFYKKLNQTHPKKKEKPFLLGVIIIMYSLGLGVYSYPFYKEVSPSYHEVHSYV